MSFARDEADTNAGPCSKPQTAELLLLLCFFFFFPPGSAATFKGTMSPTAVDPSTSGAIASSASVRCGGLVA